MTGGRGMTGRHGTAGGRRPGSFRGTAAKRLFDIVMALAALVILSPLILVIALLVRLRLGRPIIFEQARPGRGGQTFSIYKFRTMLDTRDADGELLPSSQRFHPFGQRLRALSLDELPELWNVIKGDMSLVGPRPLMPRYLPLYSPEQARRHDVRPGITGLAQVNGRNAISWEEKFALDVEYVDTHDLRMDVDIIIRTIGTVLSRDGLTPAGEVEMPDFTGTPNADTDEVGRRTSNPHPSPRSRSTAP